MLDHHDDWPTAWASASLRVVCDSLTVDEISELLDRRPSTVRQSDGNPSFAVWLSESALDSRADVADHLYVLLEELRDRREAVSALCEIATVEIWLTWSADPGRRNQSAGPSVLSADALREVADMGVDLVIEAFRARGS